MEDGPDNREAPGLRARETRRLVELLRQTKVRDPRVAQDVDQDVLRLDVAVDDPEIVEVVHPHRAVVHEFDGVVRQQRRRPERERDEVLLERLRAEVRAM